MIISDRYLGDGVYASFDGYHVILDLRAQNSARIALEPAVWEQLIQYRRDIQVAIETAQTTEAPADADPSRGRG